MGTTLEQYFRDAYERNGAIDHSLRATVEEGEVRFYIHPTGLDGETPDFSVDGNSVDLI